MKDIIQGEKFIDIADFVYTPYVHKDDLCTRVNTFNPSKFKEKNIVYTHTIFANTLAKTIASFENYSFVVITHNSDLSIPCTFEIPNNVIKWFAQNVNNTSPKIQSIPIGLENTRWISKVPKHDIMQSVRSIKKQFRNLVYMNFNPFTNPTERIPAMQYLIDKPFVTYQHGRNGKDFNKYIDQVYNHKFVISPEGNGIDTVRTWECLYMNTIPIEKRNINNQFYTDLPICFVNDWDEITENFLEKEYERISKGYWNLDKLNMSYWENKIKTA